MPGVEASSPISDSTTIHESGWYKPRNARKKMQKSILNSLVENDWKTRYYDQGRGMAKPFHIFLLTVLFSKFQ